MRGYRSLVPVIHRKIVLLSNSWSFLKYKLVQLAVASNIVEFMKDSVTRKEFDLEIVHGTKLIKQSNNYNCW